MPQIIVATFKLEPDEISFLLYHQFYLKGETLKGTFYQAVTKKRLSISPSILKTPACPSTDNGCHKQISFVSIID